MIISFPHLYSADNRHAPLSGSAADSPASHRCFPFILAIFGIAAALFWQPRQLVAAQREATMPVATTQMKPQAPQRAGNKTTPPAPAVAHQPTKNARTAPVRGFSSNPFALKHKDAPAAPAPKTPPRVIYGPGSKDSSPLTLDQNGKIVVTTKAGPDKDDRLTPRRSTFSGGTHTLPNMDKKPAPEVSMSIAGENGTTTRVTVNPQDEASPLYRPPEPEGTINSAGVYMGVEVQPNVKVQVGGEYCELDDPRRSSDEASAGAAIGLQWNF